MSRVFIATPYAEPWPPNEKDYIGSYLTWLDRPNVVFAQACLADSLRRGEIPFAPHLLYTQPGILRDEDPTERARGMAAGQSFLQTCDALVVYCDRGVSSGMKIEIAIARKLGKTIIARRLDGSTITDEMAAEALGPF